MSILVIFHHFVYFVGSETFYDAVSAVNYDKNEKLVENSENACSEREREGERRETSCSILLIRLMGSFKYVENVCFYSEFISGKWTLTEPQGREQQN